MAYTSDLPKPTDRPSDSQSLMRANSNEIATFNAVNHVAFNDASGKQGMHKWASFPTQGAPAGSYPTTAATDIAIFSQTSTYSTETELAIRKQNDGTVYEFTASQKATNGWTFLPSGMLVKWMTSGAFAGSSVVAWPTGATIPVFSAIYQVWVTPNSNVAGDPDIASTLVTWVTANSTIYNSKRATTATNSHFAHILAIGIGS